MSYFNDFVNQKCFVNTDARNAYPFPIVYIRETTMYSIISMCTLLFGHEIFLCWVFLHVVGNGGVGMIGDVHFFENVIIGTGIQLPGQIQHLGRRGWRFFLNTVRVSLEHA